MKIQQTTVTVVFLSYWPKKVFLKFWVPVESDVIGLRFLHCRSVLVYTVQTGGKKLDHSKKEDL